MTIELATATNPLGLKPCPVCGKMGKPVRSVTVLNIVKADREPDSQDSFTLCTNPSCEVVYFGRRIFTIEDTVVPIGFKQKTSPRLVCYCKGVTDEEIIDHIANRQCCSSMEDIKKHTGANTGNKCLTQNPGGT